MKKYIIFVLIINFILGCDNPDVPEVEYENIDISFSSVTFSEDDKNRLCIGDLLSLALAEADFRSYIKKESTPIIAGINREIFLFDILDKKYDGINSVFDLLKNKIKQSNKECYTDIYDFIRDLENDLGLVIKLPDPISIDDWDPITNNPFLYIRTNDFCKNGKDSNTTGIWGLHHSGINDFYFDSPKYFPLLLKQTEDCLIYDDNFYQQKGIHIRNYFDLHNNDEKFDLPSPFKIFNTSKGKYSVFNINMLMYHLYNINDLISYAPPNLDSCEFNAYSCIDKEDRLLILDSLLIDKYIGDNHSRKNHVYESSYRYYGRLFLSDNIVPLMTSKMSISNARFRLLLGSYRVSQFFETSNTTSINFINAYYNMNSYSLPEISFSPYVNSIVSIDFPNFIIAKEFEIEETISIALHNLTIDSHIIDCYIPYEEEFYCHYLQGEMTSYYPFEYENPYYVHSSLSLGFKCKK